MEAIIVLTANPQEIRVLKSVLKAMRLPYKIYKPTVEELEARLKPNQLRVWTNFKTAIQDLENGIADTMTWEDFQKELIDEGTLAQTV